MQKNKSNIHKLVDLLVSYQKYNYSEMKRHLRVGWIAAKLKILNLDVA